MVKANFIQRAEQQHLREEQAAILSLPSLRKTLSDSFGKSLSPELLSSLDDLSREPNPEILFNGILNLGIRQKSGRHEAEAQALFAWLQNAPAPAEIQKQAKAEEMAMIGGGSGGRRFEHLWSRFAEDAADYRMILPMIAGTAVGGIMKASAGSRLALSPTSAFLPASLRTATAGLAGLSAELPVFTLLSRELTRLSGNDPAQGFAHDLARNAITLGTMKLFHGLGRSLPVGSKMAMPLQSGASFLGLLAAHRAAMHFGLQAYTDDATTMTDTLSALIGMQVGAHLGNRLLGPGWNRWQAETQLRKPLPPRPKWRLSPAAAGTSSIAPRSSVRNPLLPQNLQSTGGSLPAPPFPSQGGLRSFQIKSATYTNSLDIEVTSRQSIQDGKKLTQDLKDAFLDILYTGEEEGVPLTGSIAARLRNHPSFLNPLLSLENRIFISFDGDKRLITKLRIEGRQGILLDLSEESLSPAENIEAAEKPPVKPERPPRPQTASATPPKLPPSPPVLRSYQVDMLERLETDVRARVSSWLGIASPMQTGKSWLVGPIIERLDRVFPEKPQYIILTSARIITSQIMGDLFASIPSEEIGRYDGIKKDPKRITVASIHTLRRHLEIFPRLSGPLVVLNDEAFFTQTPSLRNILGHYGVAELKEEGRKKMIRPKDGGALMIGFSGTGYGLEGYYTSSSLDLMKAIEGGWVRHMVGERIFPKIKAEEVKGGIEEKMIWWQPTLENAKILAGIFQAKIHEPGYRKAMIFVPTIQHGKLMQEALVGIFGNSQIHFVHSQMSDTDFDSAMKAYEEGGILISVRRLSRGFRGTGTEAVFHTYQTASSELFSQRTGRAWGIEEDMPNPYLYVLEAAWSRRDSFANLAKLLGLLDFPIGRIDTRSLGEKRKKIQEYLDGQKEVEEGIRKSEIGLIFRDTPILSDWRGQFAQIVQTAGGLQNFAEITRLPLTLLNGFALGCLPFRKTQVMALRDYLGGRAKALEFWVRAWEQAVDEALEGTQRISDSVKNRLLQWRRHNDSLEKKVESLEEILKRMSPSHSERDVPPPPPPPAPASAAPKLRQPLPPPEPYIDPLTLDRTETAWLETSRILRTRASVEPLWEGVFQKAQNLRKALWEEGHIDPKPLRSRRMAREYFLEVLKSLRGKLFEEVLDVRDAHDYVKRFRASLDRSDSIDVKALLDETASRSSAFERLYQATETYFSEENLRQLSDGNRNKMLEWKEKCRRLKEESKAGRTRAPLTGLNKISELLAMRRKIRLFLAEAQETPEERATRKQTKGFYTMQIREGWHTALPLSENQLPSLEFHRLSLGKPKMTSKWREFPLPAPGVDPIQYRLNALVNLTTHRSLWGEVHMRARNLADRLSKKIPEMSEADAHRVPDALAELLTEIHQAAENDPLARPRAAMHELSRFQAALEGAITWEDYFDILPNLDDVN